MTELTEHSLMLAEKFNRDVYQQDLSGLQKTLQ